VHLKISLCRFRTLNLVTVAVPGPEGGQQRAQPGVAKECGSWGEASEERGTGVGGGIRRELKRLGKEERQRQQQAVEDVIKGANVVLTTLAGALSRQIQVHPVLF